MFASQRVKRLGEELGFSSVRITSAAPLLEERERYAAWIAAGRQGEMRWINPAHVERSAEPSSVLADARSVICVALSYWTGPRPANPGRSGRVARYAWGRDYHTVIGERLGRLVETLRHEMGGDYRWYVDTGPMMDKALAARAGIGWYGKNTNILTGREGSYVLLGEIVTNLDLAPDPPIGDGCGACRLCMVACPTGALGPEYSIDSRKCISYLTIEHRGPIPPPLRPLLGNWVFGCDICQDVCPPTMRPHLSSAEARRAWARNVRREVPVGREESRHATRDVDEVADGPASSPLLEGELRPQLDLEWLLRLTHDTYVETFRGTAIKRAKVWMLRRNAAVALGNVGGLESIEPLARAMNDDDHPLVRGHAAWALGRLGRRHREPAIKRLLLDAHRLERDSSVRHEILCALEPEEAC